MARRAGSSVLGRIKKRFIALAIGLLALAFVYSSSKRAKRAINNTSGAISSGAGGGELDVKWTNFFGDGGEEEPEADGEERQMLEEQEESDAATAAVDDGPAVELPIEAEEEEAPSPSNSAKPKPSSSNSAAAKAPTPSKTAEQPKPSASGTPAATSPPPTPSNSNKPVPSSPEPKKEEPAPAAAPAAKKLTDAPQSQMQASGDFLTEADVFRPRPPQTEEERKGSPRYDKELDYDFKDTAFVTMAAGEDAGRQVIGLVSSLRASKTRVQDMVVMLSRGGIGSPQCRGEDGGEWKRKHKREAISCSGPDTIAEEIIGEG